MKEGRGNRNKRYKGIIINSSDKARKRKEDMEKTGIKEQQKRV